MLRVKDYQIENSANPEEKKAYPCEDTPVDIQNSKSLAM